MGVQGRMKGLNWGISSFLPIFQLVPSGAPDPHPSFHSHPNAPPSHPCRFPLYRQTLQGGVAPRRDSLEWPSTLIPLKSAQQGGDPGAGSPKPRTQKLGPTWLVSGKQKGYSEGLGPSVGHLGNCLSAGPGCVEQRVPAN